MRVALRKDDGVAGDQAHRRLVAELDVALAFGDQVEDHHALGAGLQQRRRRVGARRLVAPGRGEAGLDEDGADQAHDAKGFRQRVHQAAARRRCAASPAVARCDRAGHRANSDSRPRPARAAARARRRARRCARAAARRCGPACTGSPSASAMPSRPRVSERLLARTSSAVSSMPSAAAAIAMRGGGAGREPGAEQPARRDLVAAAAEFAPACRSGPACRWHGWRRRACRPPSARWPARRRAGRPRDGAAAPPPPAAMPPRCPRAAMVVLSASASMPRLWARRRAVPRGGDAACAAGRTIGQQSRTLRPARGTPPATCGRSGRQRRRAGRTARAPAAVRTVAGPRIPSQLNHPRRPHHERTHRFRRPQDPPAGRLGQRRLRRDRHHPADRRRAAGRSLRPALGRARARRRRRQRQRHARRGAPRLPA